MTARVNKSLAVAEAGGVGMVLVNTSATSLNGDFHSVPTVHLQNTARAAVKAYAATTGATASIGASYFAPIPAPLTASFSSRGPLLAGNGDLLKPDIIAPGQDILAGVAPYTFGGDYFGLLSGTSMSSPHIAGIGALLKGARPTWSPAMIKSAIMTSAGDILDGPNTDPLVIFRQGAGHVRPNSALNPGLVFNSGFNDWLGFLCGTQLPTSFCTGAGVPVLDPSDLNLASIAIGDLAGSQTVKRRVTNVGGKATYTVLAGWPRWPRRRSVARVVHVEPGPVAGPDHQVHERRCGAECLRGWPDDLDRWQWRARPHPGGRASAGADGADVCDEQRQCHLVQRDLRLRRSVLGDGTRTRGG